MTMHEIVLHYIFVGLTQNRPSKARRRRQYKLVRQGGCSREFEQHAARLRNDLRLQAQVRPARATPLERFYVSPILIR